MSELNLASIEAARGRLAGAVNLSPCARSLAFSELYGCSLYLKLENLQVTGSFQGRGGPWA